MGAYLSDEQRRQPGCPARQALPNQLKRATRWPQAGHVCDASLRATPSRDARAACKAARPSTLRHALLRLDAKVRSCTSPS
jgi:hypothetical protein